MSTTLSNYQTRAASIFIGLTLAAMLVASLLSASAQAKERLVRPESVGMSSERLQRIDQIMADYIARDLVPGTVTAVMRRGKLVHLNVQGMRDVGAQEPMTADTIFRIASMTKPITSVALMQLWEQGKFQLRDPVAKFLPEFTNMQVAKDGDITGALEPAARPIQVRDMLTHTAGLANNYRGNVQHYREVMAVQAGDNLAKFIQRLATLPLNYQPGSKWEYSIATDVVGRLVEVLSGIPLDQYLTDHLLQPLNMQDTAFYPSEDQAPRLAAQYKPGADSTIELADPAGLGSRWYQGERKLFRGAGGLVSTISDYLKFQQMMLQGGKYRGGRILAPSTVSLMLENHTGDLELWLPGPGMGFGLGYGVVVDRGAAATPLSQGAGYWGGAYCTLSWLDPDQDLVAVLMTQVRPYTHLNIRHDFQVAVYQAIVE